MSSRFSSVPSPEYLEGISVGGVAVQRLVALKVSYQPDLWRHIERREWRPGKMQISMTIDRRDRLSR